MSSKLINREKPERSLLLLKPLNEVEHGGGVKFQRGDQGYRAFRSFLDDFAKTAADKYADAASLPAADDTRRFGTELWLKLADTPPEWGERLVQVDVYARDRDAGRWEPSPIATSDRVVWGKGRLWQNSLTLLAAADSDRARQWRKGAPSLPRGKYLIKVYAVRPDAVGEPEFVGQAEVESAWPTGYSAMTVVDARRVKKE